MFFSTPLVIAVLLATGLDLDDYRPAKEGILALLGPATVALAVPLHQNRRALAANTAPAIGALVAGCVSTLVVAVVLARALALSPTVTASHQREVGDRPHRHRARVAREWQPCGTAQAITEGQLQGAAAGVAMGVAAVLTALIAPVLVPLLM